MLDMVEDVVVVVDAEQRVLWMRGGYCSACEVLCEWETLQRRRERGDRA
jgi:hypothetical protein